MVVIAEFHCILAYCISLCVTELVKGLVWKTGETQSWRIDHNWFTLGPKVIELFFFMLNSAENYFVLLMNYQEDHECPVSLPWGPRVIIQIKDTDVQIFQSSELVANTDSVSLFLEKPFSYIWACQPSCGENEKLVFIRYGHGYHL